MAIESIGNAAPASFSPTPREQAAVRNEAPSQSPAKAVETQTRNAVSQTPPTAQEQSRSVKKEELDSALKKMNEFVSNSNSDILFTTDKDTGTQIVRVVDRLTKDVIRQFPSEEAIHISKALDKLQGLLIRQKA